MVVFLIIVGIILFGLLSARIVSVMCFDKPYTEKNDFGYWSKDCYETGELYYVKKHRV